MWEFKHGNGNFKKGDLIGLREIKRRASRHALIHRDSFSGHKPSVSQPGTPAEPMPDTTDARLMNLETTIYEMHSRLVRTEDSYAIMSSKCQALTEGLSKCHQVRLFVLGTVRHLLIHLSGGRFSLVFCNLLSKTKEIHYFVKVNFSAGV